MTQPASPDPRWEELWTLFHELLERPAGERAALLDRASGDDSDLRREVLELLAAHEEGSPILDEPWPLDPSPIEAGGAAAASRRTLAPGTLVAGRFEIVGKIGAGGMGEVYEARDRSLKRVVALKFIRSADPVLVQRFVREAEMQARIQHENVGSVYEIAEVDGRHFIAMRYIDGESLGEAAPGMTLEQTLRVVAQAARGLHAAHRQGLVHRDVKPSNILLERTEGGTWKPYVMDFGLARVQESPGLTMTGIALGTPAYMAPEQALGRSATLDRRTDVYGLGATLYEALAGVPPFGRLSGMEALARMLREDPTPLRKVAPAVPSEVATIVMKCLERDPERRYSSARALADDLERYLDGEPIQARPASLLYRIRKRARKNRALLVIATLALVAVSISIAILVVSRRNAAREYEIARRFGQEAEVAEKLLRHAYTSPLHDVRPEQERVRRRLERIAAAREGRDRLVEGPASYALGRGHLALREPEAARRELQRAWDEGYRPPEVAYALGLALAGLYQQGLRELERLPDETARAAGRAQIDTTHREPALTFLRLAEGLETESPLLLEAHLAYLDARLEEALVKTRRAYGEKGWIYEARILEGDIHHDLGQRAQATGRYEEAQDHYERARAAYERAIAIARSDPLVATRMCQLELSVLAFGSFGRGQEYVQPHGRGVSACQRALVADSDGIEAGRLLAELHWRAAEAERRVGRDPSRYLDAGQEAAAELASRHPEDAVAHNHLAIVARIRGRHEMASGADPRASLERSIAFSSRAHELDPRFAYALNTLGGAHKALAEYDESRELDPRPSLERAIDAYARARAIDPEFLSAAINAAGSYLVLADWEMDHGLDPRASLSAAEEQLADVLRLNPRYVIALEYRGKTLLLRAAYERMLEQDPGPSLLAAIDSIRTGVEIDRALASSWSSLGRGHADLARHELEAGRDPTAAIVTAREAFREAELLGYQQPEPWLGRVRLAQIEARWAASKGEDPTAAFAVAVERSSEAQERFPHDVELQLEVGRLARWQAESARDRGRPVPQLVPEGVALLQQLLLSRPGHAEAHALLGMLQLALDEPEEGHRSLTRALEINPNLARIVVRAVPTAVDPARSPGRPGWSDSSRRVSASCSA